MSAGVRADPHPLSGLHHSRSGADDPNMNPLIEYVRTAVDAATLVYVALLAVALGLLILDRKPRTAEVVKEERPEDRRAA